MTSALLYGRIATGSIAAGWALALLLLVAPVTAHAQVQQAYYQGGPQQQTGRARIANYLRGGGDTWVDAHGDPAVVPASWHGPMGCPPGMGGGMAGCGQCGGGGCSCCMGGGGPYPTGGPFTGYGPYPAGGWEEDYSPYPPGGAVGGYCGDQNCGDGRDGLLAHLGLCNWLRNSGAWQPVDQCGPHYFDISAEVLYWQKERSADPRGVNFATLGINDISQGVDDAILLSSGDLYFDDEAGMRLTGRYDLGALSFLEVGYSGLLEYGAESSLSNGGSIFTAFSNFGVGFDTDGDGIPDQAVGGAGLPSTEGVDFARAELLSELHNGEISIRRYWVGHNPRVTGTVLAGVRYTRVSEELNFQTIGGLDQAFFATKTENDLVGFQAGGDMWVTVRQGWRIGAQGKAGIYNNHMKYTADVASTDLDIIGGEFFEQVRSDHVSFIGEGSVSTVFDVLPSMSLRAGYDVLFINTLALATNNFNFDNAPFLGGTRTPVLIEESSALYHGAHLGLEFVW